jgi:hypothetical protein
MSKNLSRMTQCLILFAVTAALSSPFAIAQTMNKAELKELVGTANTPKDHERIAAHFDAKAAELDEEAKDHDELAAKYAASPNGHDQKHPMSGLTAGHCKFFATKAREAAKAARQIAADHRQMAKTSK